MLIVLQAERVRGESQGWELNTVYVTDYTKQTSYKRTEGKEQRTVESEIKG